MATHVVTRTHEPTEVSVQLLLSLSIIWMITFRRPHLGAPSAPGGFRQSNGNLRKDTSPQRKSSNVRYLPLGKS